MLRIHARRFESVRVDKRADGFDAGRRRRERGRGFVLVLEERVRGAEVIGEGERWTPPGVVIEDDDALVEDVSSDSRSDGSSSSGEEELAISSADLEKYLADGGSFREEIREQFYDDDDDEDTSVEQEQKEEAIANSDLEDARRIAAYAVQSAASKPIKALSNAFERTARLSTLKSILRRNANKSFGDDERCADERVTKSR